MQKNYRISAGRLVQVQDLETPIIVFINPDEREKRYLIDDLKIDEHTLDSSLDPDELSRIEFEPQHLAAIFKRPKSYSGAGNLVLEVASTGAFLYKDKLVIVISEDVPIFDSTQFNKVATYGEVLLKMIYRSIFHFLEHLRIINKIADEVQKKINASMENKYLIDLFELQKSLVYYQFSINANGALIEKLKINAAKIEFTKEEMEFLDDISIENTQCYKQAEINSNILASLMDARASIVSNNLNILIKFLNIITIAIMVPTFVVSAFSMNVKLPLQAHPNAFWMAMGLALMSMMTFYLLWRRKKW